MAHEDTAARVAAIRARHGEYPPPEWSEVAILLAAFDAQAARLAAVAAERDALRCKHCSLTGTAHHEAWLTDPAEIAALRERATRLVALETAARAWAADVPIETGEAGLYLLAVIAGLDAPPGESS